MLATFTFLTLAVHTALVSSAHIGNIIAARANGVDYYYEDRGRIPAELMVGPTDKDGKREARKNCIFYVNQRPPMTDADPNFAKNRALNFAQLMKKARPNDDYHTLYDVYDNDKAFNADKDPRKGVNSDDTKLRKWFTVTSEEYANLCSGDVWLVTPTTEIWEKAIWWDELKKLKGTGRLSHIYELRPEDIGSAYDYSGSGERRIKLSEYKRSEPSDDTGSSPAKAKRDDPAPINIPKDIKVDPKDDETWKALKEIGNPDVNEDKDAPPSICPGANYGVIDLGKDVGTGNEGYAVVETGCKQVAGAITKNPCTDPLFGCSSDPPKINALHYNGKDYTCKSDPNAGRCPDVTVDVQFCCSLAA